MKKKFLLLPIGLVVMMTACAGGTNQVESKLNYEETKKMLVDILHTDDGKKAIHEIMTDEKVKKEFILDQSAVSDTVQKTLTSKEGADFWKESLKNPKIAAALAKGMKTENETLLKDLMKDPEYRTMMIEVFKEPEMQKEMADALKSKEFRIHLQTVIAESMQSPLFKAEMQELLLQAAKEAVAKQGKSGQGGKGGEGGGGNKGSGGGS
ncbi:spore gernimation protein GerD [Neobacillus notoginsengisoli]|uniref:Spore gernimation protein GerD n=1 Tax=Neobacillus notoginsengisoli TaxID=1578198 RepID=A0A417YLD3_9BACI|nr:spore germination lipoprotein GerD [Neobacillus notoginsengisoli]RHW33943.1 spore gernimation protein GerD [Neobacillus notoginsengisoli]